MAPPTSTVASAAPGFERDPTGVEPFSGNTRRSLEYLVIFRRCVAPELFPRFALATDDRGSVKIGPLRYSLRSGAIYVHTMLSRPDLEIFSQKNSSTVKSFVRPLSSPWERIFRSYRPTPLQTLSPPLLSSPCVALSSLFLSHMTSKMRGYFTQMLEVECISSQFKGARGLVRPETVSGNCVDDPASHGRFLPSDKTTFRAWPFIPNLGFDHLLTMLRLIKLMLIIYPSGFMIVSDANSRTQLPSSYLSRERSTFHSYYLSLRGTFPLNLSPRHIFFLLTKLYSFVKVLTGLREATRLTTVRSEGLERLQKSHVMVTFLKFEKFEVRGESFVVCPLVVPSKTLSTLYQPSNRLCIYPSTIVVTLALILSSDQHIRVCPQLFCNRVRISMK